MLSPKIAAIGFVALSLLVWHSYDQIAVILASVSTDQWLYWAVFTAFVSGVIILFPYTRLLGWFLAGNCIAMAVLSCFLLKGKFPTAFTYHGKQFVSSNLLLLWGSIGFGAGVLSLFHGFLAAKITDDQRAEIKSLEERKQELEKRVKQEDADKEQLRRERAETELQSRQIVEKLRAEVAQESECHKDAKRKRPYESQLAMLLAISLCMEWHRNYPTTPFVLNSFQGNLDRDLADIFGATNRFCWLLELKRDRDNIISEWKKPIRKLQRQQIQENSRIRDIADKCHWLAWGEKDKAENTVLRFLRYWRAENLEFHLESLVDSGAFAKRAFSTDTAIAIGVPYNKIKDYLEFLFEAAKGRGSGAFEGDSFAILAFSWSPEAGVRCWSLDMNSLGRALEKTLHKEREMTQNLSKELNRDREEREIDPPGYMPSI